VLHGLIVRDERLWATESVGIKDLKAYGVVVVDTSSVTAIQLEAAMQALSGVTQFVPPDSRATHARLHAITNPKSDAAKNRASTEDAGLLHDLSQAKVSCVGHFQSHDLAPFSSTSPHNAWTDRRLNRGTSSSILRTVASSMPRRLAACFLDQPLEIRSRSKNSPRVRASGNGLYVRNLMSVG